jgi:hypothetical protein
LTDTAAITATLASTTAGSRATYPIASASSTALSRATTVIPAFDDTSL